MQSFEHKLVFVKADQKLIYKETFLYRTPIYMLLFNFWIETISPQ